MAWSEAEKFIRQNNIKFSTYKFQSTDLWCVTVTLPSGEYRYSRGISRDSVLTNIVEDIKTALWKTITGDR